jgi:dolichol-phosphate mannosyltransferase
MNELKNVSIIMPVFNENDTIEKILQKVLFLNPKEVIIVDDGSTDGTRQILNKKEIAGNKQIKVVLHDKNQGKGAAIRTGLKYADGEIITIQDADLEYNPEEILKLVKPILEGRYSVVYGSRFIDLKERSFILHYFGNKLLNFITNIIYKSKITDMETCYKVFKRNIILSLNLKAKKFEFEPEVTAKILKKGISIYELPISYRSRSYKEGKKIGWRDGITALWVLIKYRFVK